MRAIELEKLSPEQLKNAKPLLNIIEELNTELLALMKKCQELQDEINRLKGEQGRPDIKPDKENSNRNINVSSEKERKNIRGKKKRKKRKKRNLQYHETVSSNIDKSILPTDALSKGYSRKIYQGIKIELHNVCVQREVYYSPSESKTYIADLPSGYDSVTYTPELKTLIAELKFKNMSEPKILEFLCDQGVQITAGTISNILMHVGKDIFLVEKNEIYEAGLASTDYQQTDTTGARENGKNRHSHIVCNVFHSTFFTRDRQDRSTILDILRNDKPRDYRLNKTAFELFEILRVPLKHRESLLPVQSEAALDKAEVESIIIKRIPRVNDASKLKILDAAYIAGYHAENPLRILLTDDAPQYNLIPEYSALCWIHEGRHYKKLNPVVPVHRRKLEKFRKKLWNYYALLLKYKKNPSKARSKMLHEKFDELFSITTGYDELDERIAKTNSKKEKLLLVLKFPFLPLHNNASELGARALVRQRDVSLQTKSRNGTDVRDAYLTVIETAKKLSVNVHSYLLDRIHKHYYMPSLACIIRKNACASFP